MNKEVSMKNIIKGLVLGLLIVFLYAGCAKQPTQEMKEAEAAINSAFKEGASIYAAEELEKLKKDYDAVMDEVNTQSKKLFKKYGNTKKMLAQVKADAETLKASIPTRKEQARNNAISALGEVQKAVEEAKTLLSEAPKGKGTRADIEALRADLKGLEDMLTEIRQLIESEGYFGASEKAKIVKEKALIISEQIKQALEKVKK
jgi:uncharacterized membrane-anchored protein YhcB (DUF1043 family)